VRAHGKGDTFHVQNPCRRVRVWSGISQWYSILKPTPLMVSHDDMQSLAMTCPGHHKHTVVAGKASDGENISSRSARYTPQFCMTWLSSVHAPCNLCSFACLQEETLLEATEDSSQSIGACAEVAEMLAASKSTEHSDSAVLQSLTKLHNNPGHPSVRDRILKNAGATEQAACSGNVQHHACQHLQVSAWILIIG
jgi:hypothetical protein